MPQAHPLLLVRFSISQSSTNHLEFSDVAESTGRLYAIQELRVSEPVVPLNFSAASRSELVE